MFSALRLRRLGLTLLAASLSPALAAPSVFVAYPAPDYRVAYDHVILEGSVTPGANLQIGGQAVEVGPDGLFMLWWPLSPGVNTLSLVATQGGESGRTELRVTRTQRSSLPARPTAIEASSTQPGDNIEFWDAAGDSAAERTVALSFDGSPGGKASFRVGGGAYQPMTEGPSGHYSGQFVLPPQARLRGAALDLRLTGTDGRTVRAASRGRLSSLASGPRSGTQKSGTIRGLGLNDAQYVGTDLSGNALLYPRTGMTFALVGRQGSDVRARLAPGQSLLLSADQLDLSPNRPVPAVSGPLRLGTLGTEAPAFSPLLPPGVTSIPSTPPGLPVGSPAVNPAANVAPAGDLQLYVPLGGARVPFQVEQTAPGQLTLSLYGLSAAPTPPAQTDPLLRALSIVPGNGVTGNGVTRLVLDLNTAQLWGYSADYVGSDLRLTVRRPPRLQAGQPLSGRTITVDPGHGGAQSGGAGSLGQPEKAIVLRIALRVAELLRSQGAQVSLTRSDDATLGLYERDLSAEATGSDLLVSIHANALPDGHDPRGIRGPEVHFSHLQAQPLAAAIVNQLRARLPEIGRGQGLMPGANLALTRPTTQISLLVETAYLTDPGNIRVLSSPEGQERFAQAIAAGIGDFYAQQP